MLLLVTDQNYDFPYNLKGTTLVYLICANFPKTEVLNLSFLPLSIFFF